MQDFLDQLAVTVLVVLSALLALSALQARQEREAMREQLALWVQSGQPAPPVWPVRRATQVPLEQPAPSGLPGL